MSRLFKVIESIGLGDKSLSMADVSFQENGEEIYMSITNKEKKLHDGDSRGVYSNFSGDQIARIKWKLYNNLSRNGHEYKVVIYVEVLETRQEYNKTNAVWLLLEYFNESVIQPIVSKYGADNIAVSAFFANEKLGRIIEKYVTKNMKLNWEDDFERSDDEDDDDFWDEHSDDGPGSLFSQLISAGFDVFDGYIAIPTGHTLSEIETILNNNHVPLLNSIVIDNDGEAYYEASIDGPTLSVDKVLKIVKTGTNFQFFTYDGDANSMDTIADLYTDNLNRFDILSQLIGNNTIQIQGYEQIKTLNDLQNYIESEDHYMKLTSRLKSNNMKKQAAYTVGRTEQDVLNQFPNAQKINDYQYKASQNGMNYWIGYDSAFDCWKVFGRTKDEPNVFQRLMDFFIGSKN